MEKTAPAFPLPRLRHTNLPRPSTSFIGREKELQQLAELACRERLLTITGPGGVGKTRTAIQMGAALANHFRDGVWWVELASLSRPGSPKISNTEQPDQILDDLVPLAIARVLRIPEEPGLPILEGVLETLGEKKLLLVLDNCEHLIADCATLAERLLRDCPDVSLLATSREALGIPGEKTWLLPSLTLPEEGPFLDNHRIFQSEAVRLFVDRAGEVRSGYLPGQVETLAVAQICLRLDGIPLAIELAAARMSLLSAQEIATRLDRRFSLLTGGRRTTLPRHQTLRAAIEWSFDILSEPEQVLFRRLSIFSGSFSLGAVEAICSSEGHQRDEILGLLGRLVDKSLLHVQPAPQDGTLPTRYYYLDTIRSYGRMRLDAANETRQLGDQHADYYVRLVEVAEPELLLQSQVRWFKLLQAENDNIRAVIEWSTETNQAERALRIVAALMWFWFTNGSNHEGHDLALRALSIPSAVLFKEARARALNSAGLIQIYQGDIVSARRSLEEAQSILRELDNTANLAWSLQSLGLVFAFDGNYDQAVAAFQEGLALARKLGGLHVNTFLHFLGDIEFQRGDRLRAIKTYEESATILRSMGSKSFLGYPLRRLGYLALEQNNIFDAKEYFKESLALNQEVGDHRAIAACLISIAALAMHLDKPNMATRLFGAVENRLDSLTTKLHYTDQAEIEQISNRLRRYLDEEAFTAAYSEGWEMSMERAIHLAEQVLGIESS
jgi:predicted ATPase